MKLHLPFLARVASVAASTGWLAAIYGALYIYATANFAATGSFWIFGGPFVALLSIATALNLLLAGAGGSLLPTSVSSVAAVNELMRPAVEPEERPRQLLEKALSALPFLPLANALCAMLLAFGVTAVMAVLEWRIAGAAGNVGPILLGGAIATLLYGAMNFTVSDLLVRGPCQRLRLAAIRLGLDPYQGRTVGIWVRVAVLAAPTVLALVVAQRLAASAGSMWLTQVLILVLGSGLCAALAWLQAIAIRTAAADLGRAASRLTSDGPARLITGSTDAHVVEMARAFNAGADRVDRSLQISAARTSALFEGAGDAILLLDGASGAILESNRRAEQITGRDPAELRGLSFEALFRPASEPSSAQGGLDPREGPRHVVRRDGSVCPVDVALSTVAVGDWTVVQAILHDESERDRIELQLRQSVERLEGLYHLAVTLGGTVEQVADHVAMTLAGLLGVPLVAVQLYDGDDVVMLALFDRGEMRRGDRLPVSGTPCARVRQSGEPCVFRQPARLFPAAGFLVERGIATYVGVPVIDASREVVGCVTVLDVRERDLQDSDMRLMTAFAQRLALAIDEQRQAREREDLVQRLTRQNGELRVAQERLTEADRLKSEFMGMMSHELRTPLNVFVGYTEMLLDAARDAAERSIGEHRSVLERLLAAAHSLTSLVEDTLSVLRLESGGMRVQPEPFDLNALFVELRASGRFLRLPATVAERWLVEPGVPPMRSDRLKLGQIITNLVGNARKFTREGSIVVRAFRVDADHAAISVEDTGCGIAAGELPYIFDLYRQAAASTVHNGCGIGLYIVRRYCEMLGGRVDAWSEVGRGTRMTVTLPCCIGGEERRGNHEGQSPSMFSAEAPANRGTSEETSCPQSSGGHPGWDGRGVG